MTELTTVLLSYYIMLGPMQGKSEFALATYKYSGMEQGLKTYSETYPKELRVLISHAFVIGSGISNRYIEYTWGF